MITLTYVEEAQFKALHQKPETMPVLDRVLGVLEGDPLALEQEQFEEIQRQLIHLYEAPELAARLREVANQRGGLMTREESLRRHQEWATERRDA